MGPLTCRLYDGDADQRRTIELLRECRAVEPIDPWPPIYEICQHLRAGSAPQFDSQLWETNAGTLAAFATIWDGAMLIAWVHPEAQCDEMDEQIVAWGQLRARQLARHCGERAALLVPVRADDERTGALLLRHGFRPEEWTMLRLERRLDQPLPAPALPEGFALRVVMGEEELAAIEALHQEVFVAGATLARDRLAGQFGAADTQAAEIVVVAPSGELAAFCLCSAGGAGTRLAAHEGWIDLLGTRPAYRQRGLARAALLAGLAQLQQFGAGFALLGTTSWNTRAQRLFAAAGFRVRNQVRWFDWEEEERSFRSGL